jgi:polyisoprenoid-binding protein YceI
LLLPVLSLLCFSFRYHPAAKHLTIDSKSSKADFTISNFGAPVHGSIGGIKGEIVFDEKDLEHSSLNASAEVQTINTGIKKRDKDLMGEKYFDQAKYPEITYKSSTIKKTSEGFVAVGTLTIKGHSQPKELGFTVEQKGNESIFKSSFSLKRSDYGIGGNGPIMGKQVSVVLTVYATE